jgi:predicted TIM-barrel fold metal-dependent hydrolase
VRNISKVKNENNEVYDCNFWIGNNYLNNRLSVSEEKLKKYILYLKTEKIKPNIIISNFFSLFYDPIEGDSQIESIIKDDGELSGGLFFSNQFIFNKDEFEKYLIQKHGSGFKFIRLLPKTHKYSIEPWAFSFFYSILENYRFPVMINLEELDITGNKAIEWKILYEISNEFPELPIIVDGGNSKEMIFNNYFFQLFENSNNIFLETHNLLSFNQLEDIVGNFGSKKLVFGSYYPYYPYSLSLCRIRESRMSRGDKTNIISANAGKIFGNIKNK